MSYVALYRKFRPQTFAQVKGQSHIVRTLQNQIKNNRIAHAYLFTGTRGTGKTSVAKIFAKAVNCLSPKDGEPCNECANCREITNGSFMDVVEIDAASNTGVEDIRRVIEEIRYTPVSGRYKVYIIDEVHMLSTSASNAFLKTLEEPPAYAIFILATTDPQKLPVTILSRCQRYDFRRITTAEITENINELLKQEGVEAEDKAVRYIAQLGDGSMRDALSLLDKAIAFTLGKTLTYEATLQALGTADSEVFSRVFRSVSSGNAYDAIKEFDEEVRNGKDIGQFVNDFIWYLRNLMLLSAGGGEESEILGLSEENLKRFEEDSRLVECDIIIRYMEILSSLANNLKTQTAKQAACEIALIKLAKPQMETDTASLADRIRQLEARAYQPAAVNSGNVRPQVEPVRPQPVKPQPVKQQEQPVKSHNETAEIQAEPVKASFDFDGYQTENEIQNADPAKETGIPAEITAETINDRKTSAEGVETPASTVCANWKTIVEGCNMILIKKNLAAAYVVPYENNSIRITIKNEIGAKQVENWKDKLKILIKEKTGCDVAVMIEKGDVSVSTLDMQSGADTGEQVPAEPEDEAYNEERIEQLLKENIMMDIEEET